MTREEMLTNVIEKWVSDDTVAMFYFWTMALTIEVWE